MLSILLLLICWQQPAERVARFNDAVALQQSGEFERAAAAYRALLHEAPAYMEAHANLGVVLARLGRFEEAVAAYESALRLSPHLTPLRLNLGIAHYRAAQFEKAAEVFAEVLAVAPETLQARQLLGLSLVEVGRSAEALPHLEQAAAAPDDPAVLYGLGLTYVRLNRAEARAVAARLATLPRGVAASHLLRGQMLLAGFEFERAVAELETAAKLDPYLPRLNYSLGLGYLKLGRNQEAIDSFESELRRTPRDFSTHYYLAYLAEASGDFEAARERLAAALRLEPRSPEANALLGKILVKQGKTSEALAPLEQAVAADATDPEKRYLLARVYQQLGRREEAIREFAEVQRLKAKQLTIDRARTPQP